MEEKRKIIGYATGVFDIFHIGHLNIIKNAKSMCDYLIVGVCTDELVLTLKGKPACIPFNERIEIISSIRYVDEAVPEIIDDKLEAWKKYRFNTIFKGDDWKGTTKWNELEKQFNEIGVSVVFFPYTSHISSTIIRNKLGDNKLL
jgi:glycerol-3-phosphate cytidylyltransferase